MASTPQKSHTRRIIDRATLLVVPYFRVTRIEAKQFLDSDALVLCHFTNGPKDSHHVFPTDIGASLSPSGELPAARCSSVEFLFQLLLNAGGWHSATFQESLQQGS